MIALIEDNYTIARFIIAALEIHGYHVEHFPDGTAFLTAPQACTYDLVLTDFMLPGELSGLQVITSIQEKDPMLPIIVITAASKSSLAGLCTLYPAIPIVTKPFKVQDLLQKMVSLSRPAHHLR